MADLKTFGGSVVRDVVAPIKMFGKEILINISAATGLTLSPKMAGALTDGIMTIAKVLHEPILRCIHSI